jgi:hypothetical protein
MLSICRRHGSPIREPAEAGTVQAQIRSGANSALDPNHDFRGKSRSPD